MRRGPTPVNRRNISFRCEGPRSLDAGGRAEQLEGMNASHRRMDGSVPGASLRDAPSLSVVMPAHNEEHSVEAAVDEVRASLRGRGAPYEIVLVNDGSTDGTGETARRLARSDAALRVVEQHPCRGYGGALKAGFAAAAHEAIVVYPADGQYVFAEVARLLDGLARADIVSGFRRDRRDGWRRDLNARGWNALVRWLFGPLCRDVDCGFKVIRREVLARVKLVSDGAVIDTELLAGARARGYRIAEAEITHRPRRAGRATGADVRVIARALRDLWRFRGRMRREARLAARGAGEPLNPGSGVR
jgi:glycosyltransferase involved in cell wall biosynthesis